MECYARVNSEFKKMRVVGIIQARMSSRRLPGKVLRKVNGKAIIEYLIDSIRRSRFITDIVIATSTDATDQPIVDYAKEASIPCVRGSLDDVASRFLCVFDQVPMELAVRLNADSPFMDSNVVDQIVELYVVRQPDIATNVFPRYFPKGISAEAFSPRFYRKIYSDFNCPDDFEHVTQYIYRNSEQFDIAAIKNDRNINNISFCIDTMEDFNLFNDMITYLDRPLCEYGWRDLLPIREACITHKGISANAKK